MFKIGDIVELTDYSYATYTDLTPTGNIVEGYKQYMILDLDCRIRSYDSLHTNDSIIQNIKTNRIYFVSSGFFRPVPKYCTECGQELRNKK